MHVQSTGILSDIARGVYNKVGRDIAAEGWHYGPVGTLGGEWPRNEKYGTKVRSRSDEKDSSMNHGHRLYTAMYMNEKNMQYTIIVKMNDTNQ